MGPLHSQFPAGLDTAVESDGSGLSEGEKQLICSLRAMLGESPQPHVMRGRSQIIVSPLYSIERFPESLAYGQTRADARNHHYDPI